MLLKDKVVIVTGAGPGMGQAVCRGAAREGAKVVVSARSVDAINAVRDDIVAQGGEAIAVPCDVSDMAQCRNLADQAQAKWGRIDGLVNSAYFHPDWTPLHVDEEFARTTPFAVMSTPQYVMKMISGKSSSLMSPSPLSSSRFQVVWTGSPATSMSASGRVTSGSIPSVFRRSISIMASSGLE